MCLKQAVGVDLYPFVKLIVSKMFNSNVFVTMHMHAHTDGPIKYELP